MRLIDADALTDVIERTDWYHLSEIGTMVLGAASGDNAWFREGDIFEALAEAPTIDAVPVVRCKDCKRFAYDKSDADYYCTISACVVAHNDFCSYGERKDGDTDD